jgi:tRNA threonylcarbamoyladenosine biosynthesis protein TsaB
MTGNWLILETSDRVGKVGLARGGEVVRTAVLDDRRRHVRDLAFTISTLLEAESLRPVDLAGVAVGRGPGSYTGLRVGLMSAKALAYAVGCELRTVETFAAIAYQAPKEAESIWVIADALQGQVYSQHFVQSENSWRPAEELRIEPMDTWAGGLRAGEWVSGPGVALYKDRIPGSVSIVPEVDRQPSIESVCAVAKRVRPLSSEELLAVEPLYLRGSAAEEKRRSEPRR